MLLSQSFWEPWLWGYNLWPEGGGFSQLMLFFLSFTPMLYPIRACSQPLMAVVSLIRHNLQVQIMCFFVSKGTFKMKFTDMTCFLLLLPICSLYGRIPDLPVINDQMY